jgi:Leucine-rich repeat (LRR) protein
LDSLPTEFGNLQNLKTLDLTKNLFRTLPIEMFKQMPNLKEIVLKYELELDPNPLQPSDIEALRRAMPWCEIVWE